MAIPQIGNVDIAIVMDILSEPAIIILLLLSGLAGLLRGKMENDQARLGIPEYKGMENNTIYDWGEDFGLGTIGGVLGLAIMFTANGILSVFGADIPIFILPIFGYAGRKLLIAWGRKAETAIPKQP